MEEQWLLDMNDDGELYTQIFSTTGYMVALGRDVTGETRINRLKLLNDRQGLEVDVPRF